MKKAKIEFDIVDQAYRFFHERFPEVNDDNIYDCGPAYAAIESFANFIDRRVNEVIDADIDLLNEYLQSHVPEDILWYKDVCPILVDLILYWHSKYLNLKYHD